MRFGGLTVVNTKVSEAWNLVIFARKYLKFMEVARSIFKVED
jgi:hypothetical protein